MCGRDKLFTYHISHNYMNILVTGGAGFIGRHLVNSFLSQGHNVTIFDNFSNSNMTQMSNIIKNGASFVKGDIANYKSILKHSRNIDFIIHLAAKINVNESILLPELTHKVNVTGTLNLLRACVANGVQNIIAASSAAVYGNTTNISLSENSETVPISPYGASKLAIEHYLQAFSNSHSINSVSLRFFNIYGTGQSITYAGVIEKFMEQIKKNKSLVIYGDGKNTRDFISIDDIVKAVNLTMKKITNKKGVIYNIATGRSVSINELAKLMILISGKKIAIVYKNPKIGDIRYSQASIRLAKKEIGYAPKIMLKDGLEKLMKEN